MMLAKTSYIDRTINMTFSTSLHSLIASFFSLLFLWCSSLFWVSLLINISEHLLNSPLIPLNLSAPFFPNCQRHIGSFLSVIWVWDQLFNISAAQRGKKSKRRNKVQPSVLMGQRGSSVHECCLSKWVVFTVCGWKARGSNKNKHGLCAHTQTHMILNWRWLASFQRC